MRHCFAREACDSALGSFRVNVFFFEIASKYQRDLMDSEHRTTEEFVLEGIF